MEPISTTNAPAASGPYSQAVKFTNSNGMLYISGQLPLDTKGQIVGDTIEKQTEQVMKNIQAILTEAGLSFKQIVKSEIFITNGEDFRKVNAIYASYFTAPFPARSTAIVKGIPKGVLLEIAAIAII